VSLLAERGKTLSGLYGDRPGSGLEDLTRASIEMELLKPTGRRTGLALRMSGQSLDTPARPVPQYDLFSLGGATTLRGYREEQFYTPGYLLTQLEYRLLSGRLGSGAYLFVDTALFSLAEAEATLIPETTETRLGYGAGLRVGSRLGRVGLDYGLASGEAPLEGRIHVRIEAEF
jgi:outer membrane protein insertion porin family